MSYADRLPELAGGYLLELFNHPKPFDTVDVETQIAFVEYCFSKMEDFFSCKGYYSNDCNERMRLITIWRAALCDITPRCIIAGLYAVLKGLTEHKEWPPKSAVSFYSICKNGTHNQIHPSNHLALPEPEPYWGTEEGKRIAAENLVKIKAMLKAALVKPYKSQYE